MKQTVIYSILVEGGKTLESLVEETYRKYMAGRPELSTPMDTAPVNGTVTTEQPQVQAVQQAEDEDALVEKFYNQANESFEDLLTIRSGWDAFLVPTGMGSRIPQRFISPPPPSTEDWNSFLTEPIVE